MIFHRIMGVVFFALPIVFLLVLLVCDFDSFTDFLKACLGIVLLLGAIVGAFYLSATLMQIGFNWMMEG